MKIKNKAIKMSAHSIFEKNELITLYTFFWISGIAALVYLATLPLTAETQIFISGCLLLPLFICYQFSRHIKKLETSSMLRLVIFLLAALLSFRYLYWRGTQTLPLQYGVIAGLVGCLLFLVESFYFLNSMLGYFISIKPKVRQAIPLPADPALLPHIDVYIPTFDESPDLVGPTLIAATQMRYPQDKLHVYLLDDGGTSQKLNNPNRDKAAAALERSNKLKAIANQFGATYLSRELNEHAKAGNLNNALRHTSGELLVVLDCDHVPAEDFVEQTVGFFLADPTLFLLQTPHNFVNADPVERNLSTFATSPGENELFYSVMQPGMDAWGSTFFCGSAAVLRRSVIDEIGGIAGETITEDAETTLNALKLGYTTAYFNKPMVSGLQPETFSGFLSQRVRWSQGMLQIFLLKKPWAMRGLTLAQRLLFTNFSLFWGFSVARMLLLLVPPLYLIFSIQLLDASATDVLIFGAPNLFGAMIISQYLFGRVRWPFVSQIYEVIQSFYVTRSIVYVLMNPRKPTFQVTPKGEVLQEDFVSDFAKPFYIVLFFNIASIGGGIYRLLTDPSNHSALYLVGFWAAFDFFLLLCALGITFERRQRRTEPRSLHDEPIILHIGSDIALTGNTIDASASGVKIAISYPTVHRTFLKANTAVVLEFPERGMRLPCEIQSVFMDDEQRASIGIAYKLQSIVEERAAIAIAFGSSEQLMKNKNQHHKHRSVLGSFVFLFRLAMLHGFKHLAFLAVGKLRGLFYSLKKIQQR
jgi:cellulose synthase (UDP-forming)